MKKWKKISDYLFFQEGPGVRNHQYTSNGIKLLNVANLVNGRVDLSTSDRYISNEEAYGKYKHFLVDEGDLIIASSGIKVDYFDKKMGFIKKEHLPICMNTSTIRLKSLDNSKLNINYFMYYLKSKSFKDQLSKQITGSAQLNFGPSHLKKMEFPIVDISEQSLINSVLGSIENQIKLKEQQLSEYDQLIKSQFVEMFGDPEVNPYGWGKVPLSKVITYANNGMARRGNDEKGNIVIRLVELQDGFINYSSPNRILLEENEKKRYLLKDKDFLFARVNGNPDNVGRCAVFHEIDEEVYHNDHIIRVHFKEEVLDCTFASILINSPHGKRQLKTQIKTSAGQYTISQDGIGSIMSIIPPIELQNQFADFVKQVDKLKFSVQKSLDETQKLFDSLMQEYFG